MDFTSQPSTEAMLDAIAVMTNWRSVPSFRCEVREMSVNGGREFELVAHPMVESFTVTEKKTGVVESFDAATGTRWLDGQKVDAFAYQVRNEPYPVRLAWPMSLPIWGRGTGEYRMVGAERADGEVIVELRHLEDPHLFGSVTVDLQRRMCVRLDVPTGSYHYVNIQSELGSIP
ncbi:hypothetical protein ACWG8W_01205 [Citricoccus zhacaiensis]